MTLTPGRPSSCGRSGPSPTNVSVPSPSRPKASREPDDVLPLDQRADADERGARPRRALEQPEPLQVDAAVDDLGLRRGRRDRRDEPPAQPVGDRDHLGRALHDATRRRADERVLGQVGDVLPVRGDDERRPRGPCREQPREAGRKEEVRVDDVGPKPPRGPHRPAREPRVAQLAAAAAVEHDPLEDVPARRQLALQALDEDAEIGGRRGGVHLGDEQDAHRRII